LTALDAVGYAVGEPAAKGGPVLYRAAFIVIFTLLTVIRIWFRVATGAFRERLYADREEWRFIALRGVFGIPLATATAVFVFSLPWAPWSFVSLPGWSRWLGAGLAFAAVVLVAVVHRTLDGSFSPTIRLRMHHSLVTTGPYRLARHPMYTAYLMLFLGAFLLSANWAIGAGGIGVILTLMTARLAGEERRLEERFGAAWLAYREATGAFLPRLRRPAPTRARPRRAAASLGGG
jgi:protein-S-isoprenylcysteine O-methyltransferase Ste14